MPYNRDQVAAELLKLYELLVKMYLSEDDLIRPPPGGWEQITPARLSCLKKNDTVVDLYKHLPYIKYDWPVRDDPRQIYIGCVCVDYASHLAQEDLQRGDTTQMEVFTDPPSEPEPAVALLGRANDHTDFYISLDTDTGEVKAFAPEWTEEHTFEDIVHFSTTLQQEFRDFSLIVYSPDKVESNSRVAGDTEQQSMIQVYRDHGWPDGQYDKEKCLAKVKETVDRIRAAERAERQAIAVRLGYDPRDV